MTSSANALDFIINGLSFNNITLVYYIAKNKKARRSLAKHFFTFHYYLFFAKNQEIYQVMGCSLVSPLRKLYHKLD